MIGAALLFSLPSSALPTAVEQIKDVWDFERLKAEKQVHEEHRVVLRAVQKGSHDRPGLVLEEL